LTGSGARRMFRVASHSHSDSISPEPHWPVGELDTMAFIQWLHRGALPRNQVGGKAAALSELHAAGFSVPVGFAITADGYRHFDHVLDIASQVRASDASDPSALRAAAVEAARVVTEAKLPHDLRQEISAAYDELVSLAGLASAVRSSGISEDGAGASFAGLYESFLNVHGLDDVLDAVRSCYASLWTERAMRYRAVKGIGEDAMAVVVMGLVPSEASGIAFTAHPVTGERDRVVINSSWGLGEAIVSGRVTPDSFVVHKDTLALLARDVYDKQFAIYPHPDGGGTIERTLPPERASAPSISDAEAQEVASVAFAVERCFGSPQDVEWGIHDHQLFLLQARPITTLN
jgi:phosphoenolpyruvate synthase/pyruvate phosphate dikinase